MYRPPAGRRYSERVVPLRQVTADGSPHHRGQPARCSSSGSSGTKGYIPWPRARGIPPPDGNAAAASFPPGRHGGRRLFRMRQSTSVLPGWPGCGNGHALPPVCGTRGDRGGMSLCRPPYGRSIPPRVRPEQHYWSEHSSNTSASYTYSSASRHPFHPIPALSRAQCPRNSSFVQ